MAFVFMLMLNVIYFFPVKELLTTVLLCEVMADVFVLTASIGSSSLMTSFTPDQGLQEDSSKPLKRPKIEG